jgi:hypothetical protein
MSVLQSAHSCEIPRRELDLSSCNRTSYMIIQSNTCNYKKYLHSYLLRLQCMKMKKDAPLAFRISSELKDQLQKIAEREARSVSQICHIFLKMAVEAYEKEGPRYLQKIILSSSEKR